MTMIVLWKYYARTADKTILNTIESVLTLKVLNNWMRLVHHLDTQTHHQPHRRQHHPQHLTAVQILRVTFLRIAGMV